MVNRNIEHWYIRTSCLIDINISFSFTGELKENDKKTNEIDSHYVKTSK